MSERMKLNVIEAKPREEVGKNNIPKLTFKAVNKDNKEFTYFTFRTSLFETIEAKGEIDAEVDIAGHEYDGNTYTDRKVTQIYKDGQPIGGQKKAWGKSPEMIMAELESKAKNTALMSACDLAKSDKIEVKIILKKAQEFYEWLRNGQEKHKGRQESEAKGQASTPKTALSKEPTNLGELLTWIQSHGKEYGREWLFKNQSCTEEELKDPEKVKMAYLEIKQNTGWE